MRPKALPRDGQVVEVWSQKNARWERATVYDDRTGLVSARKLRLDGMGTVWRWPGGGDAPAATETHPRTPTKQGDANG